MRTGVSARLMSLIGFGWPSTINSKSSNLKFVTAIPRASRTVVGTATRFEVTLTTSSESSSAGDGLGVDGVDDFGREEICRGLELLFADGVGAGFFCRPDWESMGRQSANAAIEIEKNATAHPKMNL
jgi:hypothetical protein